MTDTSAPASGDLANPNLARAVVEAVPEAIIVSTPEGLITFINPAAERLLGYAAAEVVGRSILTLVPPTPGRRADPVKWLARWAAEPQPEQARYLDFQARRRDGREMPVDVRVSEGRLDGARRFFITVRDNTVRRQEQAAFREANLRAARVMLVAEDAIVTCDADQAIIFFNPSAERMFGWRVDDILGKPLDVLLPESARPRHGGLVAGFAASSSASRMMSQRAEVQGRRADGSVFPIEATITKVSVAGAMTFTAHLRDVSARKAAEARLAESERRFRAMFDHAQGALALLSPDGTVLEINRAAQALTMGGEALTGRPLWDLPWLGTAGPDAPAGRERLKEGIAAAAKGLAVRFPAELREGDTVHRIDLSLTPIADETGRVIYILPEGRQVTTV